VAWNGSDFVKIVSNPLVLTTDVSGVLPIANGGTGTSATTFASLTTNVSGVLPVANGGSGTTTPSLVAGTNVTISGTWPNQTVNSSGGGGGGTVTSVAMTVPAFLSVSGSPVTSSGTLAVGLSGSALPVANGGTGTATPSLVAGSNVSITGSWPNQTVNSSGGSSTRVWSSYTASTTYTVPAGVTSIRVYAFGKGGNGFYSSGVNIGGTGGGGGGCAFGDIAVAGGATVTINISSGIATVVYSGTTMLTANPGSNGLAGNVSVLGGAGGTATKDVLVTNGGAYSGGAGGSIASSASGFAGGGGSAGSPLGVGYSPSASSAVTGGAGWNSGPSTQAGGNGGGSDGTLGGGFVYNTIVGPSPTRSFEAQYTETLLSAMNLTGMGGYGAMVLQFSSYIGYFAAQNGTSGGGGGAVVAIGGGAWPYLSYARGGSGGNGSGGGATELQSNNSYSSSVTGGNGGFGGGGGACRIVDVGGVPGSFITTGGVGGYGGGGGGVAANGFSYSGSGGVGGGAIVLIYA
jgi:hypothetical protein